MKMTPLYATGNADGTPFEAFLRCCDFLKTNDLLATAEPTDVTIEILSYNNYVPYIGKSSKTLSFYLKTEPLEKILPIARFIFISSDYRYSFVTILESE